MHATPMPPVTSVLCAPTLQMLERFYWWIGMEACTKWWVRRCLKCQARKTSRQTVRWPVLPIPLPNSSGVAVSVDYFGPLPITARGNSYILLFTENFNPLRGCASILLFDNGRQFCARLATAVYNLLGIDKLTMSAYHSSGGGVERVNHTMAQILAIVCNEHQNTPPFSAAMDLAPNEVHIGRPPRPPPSPSLIDRTVMLIRTSTATNSPIATSLASVNNWSTNLCENSTYSPLLG